MRHVPLDYKVLEDFLSRSSSGPQSAWEDLAALVPYLEDHLVLVERAPVFEGGVCNLAVFVANDEEKTPLYVLVASDGIVRVGRVDRLDRCAKLHLGEFDRLWHGVLSIAVTRRQRLLGTRQDLWIVVRRKGDDVVVYHGLVDLDDNGDPVVQAAVDDWGGSDERVWKAGKAKGLPEWLSCCNFACPPDVDPFEELPETIQRIIQKVDGDPAQQVEAVFWTGNVLGLALGHEVRLHGTRPHSPPAELNVGERVRTVVLTQGPSGSIRGIAAPDSHRLRAFETREATAEIWRQWTHEFPMALAFLPAEEGTAWPDLLVAFQDGEIHRLTFVGKERLREAWRTVWNRLLPEDTPDRRIAAAREVEGHENKEVRRAALIGVVEKVIAEAPFVMPGDRNRWLEEVSLLFRPAERFQVLSEPLRLLLAALEKSLFGRDARRPLTEEARFLAALIYRLYTGQLYLAMQDQVDAAFRGMDLSEEHLTDERLRELADRSVRNREKIWDEPPECSAPQDLIERSIFSLERWANAYLSADAEQVAPSRKEVLTGVAVLPACPGAPGPWVVFGRREELRTYTLDNWSRLSRMHHSASVSLPGALIQDVLAVGETGVVVAHSSGELSVWNVNPGVEGPVLVRRGGLDLSKHGVPWAMARCEVASGPVIAVVCNRRRISTVVLCSAEPEGLKEIAQISLDLPRVRSLDLSVDGAGNFLLAAGSVHSSPVRIHRIDPTTGLEIEKRWLRVLESGASAVRFASTSNPDLLLAGERNGLLWCCDLTSTSDIADLLWTYDLGGAIRAIEPVIHDSRFQFLAGAENGKLVLLDGRTGRRVWKHRLPGAIRQIREVRRQEPDGVIVTLRGGRAVSFTQVKDRETPLQEVKKCLTALGPDSLEVHKDLWETATAEPAQTLFRLLVLGERESEVLKRFPAREARARLVRYLAEQVSPPQLRDRPDVIVGELSRREMALLLSSLEDAVAEWDEPIARKLEERRLRGLYGDDGRGAEMASAVVLLQRRGRRDAARLLWDRLVPSAEALSLPWTRLELARIFLSETARQMAPQELETEGLLVALLPRLLGLPLNMVQASVQVIRYDSSSRIAFSSLNLLLEDLSQGNRPKGYRGRELAESLRWAEDEFLAFLGKLAGFLAAYLELQEDLFDARQNDLVEWRRRRRECLVPLRELARSAARVTEAPEPFQGLVRSLRRWLSEPFPQDQVPLSQRTAWLRAARGRLEEDMLKEKAAEGSSEWRRIAERLTDEARKALEVVERWESQHVSVLTRPFLKLLELEIGEGNKTRLRLRFEPEGQRQLEDVTILFQVTSDAGLQGPGQLEARYDALRFPGRTVEREIELSGFLRPGQESITVDVEVRDGGGYSVQERWIFTIRKTPTGAGRLSVSGNLPKIFQKFLDTALQCSSAACFLVIDEDLGRAELVERWRDRTGGRVVSLDDQLRNIGKGRRYPRRGLDLDLLARAWQGVDPLGTEDISRVLETDASKPLLVTPLEETLERMNAGEAEGLIDAWLFLLRQRVERNERPQWFFVLSSLHACTLRRFGLGKVEEIALHRVPFPEADANGRPLREEIESLLRDDKESGLPPASVQKAVDVLGGDVRLAFRWLRWLREDVRRKGAPAPVEDFLASPGCAALLHAELRSLAPLELLTALVAAEAVTYLPLKQVSEGQIAAADFHSSTKKSAPKLVQKKGEAITERSLKALGSDSRRIDSLAIQGLGLSGTIEAPHSHLLALVTIRRRGERQESFRRLRRMGIGSLMGEVFRTGSPYRELIGNLQDTTDRPADSRWEAVYAALAGKERSPVESLSLAELARLPFEDLEKLFPASRSVGRDDLRALRRLAEFWNAESQDEVEGGLTQLFRPDPVTSIVHRPARWDTPLASLPWPVFGIGRRQTDKNEDESYPDTYVIWSPLQPLWSHKEIERIGVAAEETERLFKQRRQGAGEKGRSAPRVLVLGPGADGAPLDPARRVAVLRAIDLCRAAWEGDLRGGVLRRAGSQMKLTARSPFQASGALPPGSSLFVGRSSELAFIKGRIRRTSILILGSRRVGKTSLLNQVDHWAQAEPDLEPVFVDLQGCRDRDDFIARLARQLPLRLRDYPTGDLDTFARSIQQIGKTLILLLNEIDGLLLNEPDFISAWRGLNDRQLARFLMVGYSAIGALGLPTSPFFHFTEGDRFGDKALVLGELKSDEGKRLLDQLETALGVRWESDRDRELSYTLCLDRSYRIPWVLQRYAHLLVEHLETSGKGSLTLSFQEVERVVETEGRVVWNYIEGIDYQSLGFGKDKNASRPAYQLILVAVARKKYFLGGASAPIRDPHLSERSALDEAFVFSVGEARDIVKGTIANLLTGNERHLVQEWFDSLDLEKAFRLLTLTLMLEPDPGRDRSYGFLLHILPRELHQLHASQDPTLDSLFVQQAVEFLSSLKKSEVRW